MTRLVRTRPTESPHQVIADWQELRIKQALGQEFRSTSTRIIIRRPWWLPAPLYRRIMRSIVIEERPATVAPRAARRRTKARTR